MKILLFTAVDPWVRSVSTVHGYVAAGRRLGHEVLVYGDPMPELPKLPFTRDVTDVDLALFVVQVPFDFPDMPHLARVLDGIPRERRVLVDLWGRYNDTIRLEHDFNHLEKIDRHPAWEWSDAIEAVTDRILQPTFAPMRSSVTPFLFHGFDAEKVARPYATAKEAAAAWRAAGPSEKPYGAMYIGNNWHRWHQVRSFMEAFASLGGSAGKACLVGWDWKGRPDWAVDNGIIGVDTDPDLLARLGVEIRDGVRFDEVVALLGQARFAPVLHRPLFRHLNFVTNRTFETFCADTIPVLMLPKGLVTEILGPAAGELVPHGSVGEHLADVLARPERYWDAVLQTRTHLATHHSFERRIQELEGILAGRSRAVRAGGAR